MVADRPRRHRDDTTKRLWFALLLTLANGFLDAHTYIVARRGVRQRPDRERHLLRHRHLEAQVTAALAHVWPLLAFIAGIALASHIKSGRVEHIVP